MLRVRACDAQNKNCREVKTVPPSFGKIDVPIDDSYYTDQNNTLQVCTLDLYYCANSTQFCVYPGETQCKEEIVINNNFPECMKESDM